VFRRGPVWRALLASMSIPGIYPPQRFGRFLLVDGGVLNPVPSNVAAAMGADVVIAVKLAWQYPQSVEKAPGRTPSVIETILRSFEAMEHRLSADTAAAATIQIEPVFPDPAGMGLRRFRRGRRYEPYGEAAAEAALPRITAALPWLRRGP
jgi:NTE family protein